MRSVRIRLRPESNASSPVVLCLLVALTTTIWLVWKSDRAAVEFLIFTVGVVGLYVYSGGSGVVSFGHVGFMAVGGYCSAIFTVPTVVKDYKLQGLPGWLEHYQGAVSVGLLIAAAAGAVAAAIFGLLIWKLSGLAASIGTLTLMMIVFTVASGWEDVTGGRGAMPSVPHLVSVPATIGLVVVVIFLAAWYQRTRGGRLLRTSREDPSAASAIGVHIERLRWTSLVLSGAIMGLAGGLYVHFVGSVSPDFFYVSMLFTLLVMLVIGGMTSLTGAVVGTIVVRFVRELLAPLDDGFSVVGAHFSGKPGLRFVVLGVLLIVMLARRPDGLMRGREITLVRSRAADAGGRSTTEQP